MERILDMLLGAAITAGVAFMMGEAHSCDLMTTEAVHVAYAANDTVQRAVDADNCTNTDIYAPDDYTARDKLNAVDKVAYTAIDDALIDAYREADGTDSEIQKVTDDFCEAMGER